MDGLVTTQQFLEKHNVGKPGAYLRAERWVRIIEILDREAHCEIDPDRQRDMQDDLWRLKHELGIKAQ